MIEIESVAELRKQLNSKGSFPIKSSPGVYRWWFPKNEAEKLLKKFKSPMQHSGRILQAWNIDGTPYYAIYFGMSSNLRRRIRWHICGPFKKSTLRRTLRALVAPNANEKTAGKNVDKLIDSCFLEWQYTSDEKMAKAREKDELNQITFAYPLNIQENRTMSREWIKELKEKRK